MAVLSKLLAQVRPLDTAQTDFFSPIADTSVIIKTIVVCNTTTSAEKFSIWQNEAEAVYADQNALYRNVPIPAETTVQIDGYFATDQVAAEFGVQVSTGDTITFTMYGAEIT